MPASSASPALPGEPRTMRRPRRSASLSLVEADPQERFAVGSRNVTPADLVQSARDRFDDASFAEDSAWLIEAVTYGRDPTQGWVSARGEPTCMMTPSFMTAISCDSASASAWSWVT